jgi:ABC-type branched-subunit amino acid transport system permease subunit
LLGFVVTTIGIVLSIYFILLKIIEPTRIVEGWTTIVLLMLVIGGVQLFIMGIIGEYIGRIYTEGQKRPLYLIRESINFESSLIDD